MSKEIHIGMTHLTPIIASLLFGISCAFLIATSQMEMYNVTPFSEGVGSFGNAIYFVILVGVGASILYLLMRTRRSRLISLLTGFALTLAVFMLSTIYLSTILEKFTIPYMEIWILASAIAITALADYAIFKSNSKLTDLTVLLLGGALGSFLGSTIPTLSTILILGFLAVYDTFAVYRGPVGKIAKSGLEQLKGLSFSFKEMQMGLGDLTFYSMLSGHMLIFFGWIPCIASLIGILLGCVLAFKMLERKGMFPGLPFPILFGLVAGFIAFYVYAV